LERVISTGKGRHPVLNEKAVSAAATRTCEMAKGTYFGDIRYRPFDQDLGDTPADICPMVLPA
jgi:hypothetical protein